MGADLMHTAFASALLSCLADNLHVYLVFDWGSNDVASDFTLRLSLKSPSIHGAFIYQFIFLVLLPTTEQSWALSVGSSGETTRVVCYYEYILSCSAR